MTEWVREYAAGGLTLDELAERVSGFEFKNPSWGQDSYWEKEIPAAGMEVDCWEELRWAAMQHMSSEDWLALVGKVNG